MRQQQSVSSLSFLSNIPSPTTILHSSYSAVAGAAGSIYSASSWLGGKVFGNFNTLINNEQKFNAEHAQRAKTNLSTLEVEIAEKVRNAVTIMATGTAFYYNPSLTLGIFAALRLIPQNAVRAVYQTVFNNDQAAVAQALSTQDLITKGFSLYYGMLPASLIQAVVVGGVETTLKKLNSNNALPQSYIKYNVGERLWLWSGTIASVYQDHRFVTNQQIQRNTVEQIQIQTGDVTRVNSFNCRLTIGGEECSIVQQSIAVQNQQTGDMFYATVNVDAAGIKTPISLATVDTNGAITNHPVSNLIDWKLFDYNFHPGIRAATYTEQSKQMASLISVRSASTLQEGSITITPIVSNRSLQTNTLQQIGIVSIKLVNIFFDYGYSHHIAVSDDDKTAFVSSEEYGLSIINVSNHSFLVLLGATPFKGGMPYSVAISHGLNYLMVVAGASDGIYFINITNLRGPIPEPRKLLAGNNTFFTAVTLTPDNSLLFATNGRFLKVHNMRNLTHRAFDGSSDLGNNSAIEDLERAIVISSNKRTVFFADGDYALFIFDVKDIKKPKLISFYQTIGYPKSVALSSDEKTVFLAVGMNSAIQPTSRLEIVDVSNPKSPFGLSSYPTFGSASCIKLSSNGRILFLADSDLFENFVGSGGSSRKLLTKKGAGLMIFDVTDLKKPALLAVYDTPGSAEYFVLSSDERTVFLADGSTGTAIIEINFNTFSVVPNLAKPIKVGVPIFESLNFHNTSSNYISTIDVASIGVKQIAPDKITRLNSPDWLTLEGNTMTLTGIAPKEAASKHFDLDISFTLIPLTKTQTQINRYSVFTSFNVVSSLNLNKTVSNYRLFNSSVPTLLIDAVAPIITVTLTLSSISSIKFITSDNFGLIRPVFDESTGIFEAVGAVYYLNEMLKRIRYQPLTLTAINTSLISVGVIVTDADLNYPIKDVVDINYFRENQAPVCNKNITEASYEINSNFDYTIALGECVDADDSIDGASLKYNAFVMNNSVALPLPVWLSFTSDQRRFFGTIPAAAGAILIQVNVTDGYAIDYLFYRFIFQRPPNRAPILEQQIPLQSAQIGTDYEYFVPITTFSDPDGDSLTLNASGMPSWLEFNTSAWRFYGSPRPSDTDSFNDRQTIISLQANDGDKTVMTSFIVAVRGDSVVSLIISYGGTALGILGTIYGFYVYRNPIYNAIVWNRYRHLPEQFGQQVEAVNLFGVSSQVEQKTIPLAQDKIESAVLTKWSSYMPKYSDQFGEYYFKHKVLDYLGDAEAARKRKKITETKSFFVRARPTVTTRQKLKTGLFTAIPRVFNATFGRILARFGIKMNPDYLAIYEPVYGDLPSWLSYNQNTGVLKVVDVENDDNTPFDTLIVVQFFNSYARIMEEISFIVRDEGELCSLFPGAIASANSGHQPTSSPTTTTESVVSATVSVAANVTPNSVTAVVNGLEPVADTVEPITKDNAAILTVAPIKALGENGVTLLVPRPPPLIAPSVPMGRTNSSPVVGGNGASLPIAAHFLPKVPVNSLDAYGAGAGRLRTSAFTRPVESSPSVRTDSTPVTHLFGMPMIRMGGYKPLLYRRHMPEAAGCEEEMRISSSNNIINGSRPEAADAEET